VTTGKACRRKVRKNSTGLSNFKPGFFKKNNSLNSPYKFVSEYILYGRTVSLSDELKELALLRLRFSDL